MDALSPVAVSSFRTVPWTGTAVPRHPEEVSLKTTPTNCRHGMLRIANSEHIRYECVKLEPLVVVNVWTEDPRHLPKFVLETDKLGAVASLPTETIS